ncbi:MAG: hypothetical protein AAF409_02210 [Pseudomonadota bacterium]
MASLNRAYGARGAAIALALASVVGLVHGTMAASFDYLGVKIGVGVAGAVMMIIAGVVSARRSVLAALATGLAMGCVFFVVRWAAWATIVGGPTELMTFFGTTPWGWPAYLSARGISGFWIVEATSMTIPALVGCIAGQERTEDRPSSVRSSS